MCKFHSRRMFCIGASAFATVFTYPHGVVSFGPLRFVFHTHTHHQLKKKVRNIFICVTQNTFASVDLFCCCTRFGSTFFRRFVFIASILSRRKFVVCVGNSGYASLAISHTLKPRVAHVCACVYPELLGYPRRQINSSANNFFFPFHLCFASSMHGVKLNELTK